VAEKVALKSESESRVAEEVWVPRLTPRVKGMEARPEAEVRE
jgi:hypothetical protein